MNEPDMSRDSKTLSKFKPANEDFEFRQFPFYWVMRLSNRYTHKMEVALKKVNMNITVWRVGMILREHGDLSITEITTHAVSRLPTITKTVYKMQERGLVEINPHKEDGRVSIVNITQEGINTIESVIANTTRVFDTAFEDIPAEQLQQLNETLQKIFLNMDH